MRKYFPVILLLGCAALFAFGIRQLFELRFEAGDVYPPYSSLRADPLGTMAFYESLGKMPGISVRRDFSESNRLPEEPAAYLHLAAGSREWREVPDDLFREMKSFLARGGRLVIAYFPQTTAAHRLELDDEDQTNSIKSAPLKSEGANALPVKPAKKKTKTGNTQSWVNLEAEWGFHEGFEKLEPDGDNYQPVSVANQIGSVPHWLNWHSGMMFTNCNAAWRTIYARGTNAVVIERKFGNGSVVLASDSFFVSNEAMAGDRHAELLAWIVGANNLVVFDEAHLGIVESPGLAALMRKYRLHGLAAGLLLLAGLFIWKNSTSLVPPHADEQREDFVTGKDAASGFVNLLRRSIAPREVFGVCFAEWKKSAATSGTFSSVRLQQAEAVFQSENSLPAGQRNPIATYKIISETLGQQKTHL
jgi:hypothetical protein